MIVKLLTEHHFEFEAEKEASETWPSLHLSKCQIVGNLSRSSHINLCSDACYDGEDLCLTLPSDVLTF